MCFLVNKDLLAAGAAGGPLSPPEAKNFRSEPFHITFFNEKLRLVGHSHVPTTVEHRPYIRYMHMFKLIFAHGGGVDRRTEQSITPSNCTARRGQMHVEVHATSAAQLSPSYTARRGQMHIQAQDRIEVDEDHW